MPDYSGLILPVLKGRKSKFFNGRGDVLLPSYDGYGLANLPASVSQWLGGPELALPPLADEILSKFKARYKRVVLLLADALGYNLLHRYIAAGKAAFWLESLPQARAFPITSVTPSTTATALTTIWTGAAPSQHGYIGYEMWSKELCMIINTILHLPIAYADRPSPAPAPKVDPQGLMELPNFGCILAHSGIESHAFQPANILGSGLSSLHLNGTVTHGYFSESDLWVSLRDNLNSRPANPKFIYAYWSTVDTLMHKFGPDDERVLQAFDDFTTTFKTCFLDGLEDWAKKDTLFILTADHGGLYQPQYEFYNLNRHPGLLELLTLRPTCEARLPFLYVKEGKQQAVREYFETVWPGKFTLITREEAFEAHLLGPDHSLPCLQDRVGDLLAISHDDAYLWWAPKPNMMLGRHGGLNPDEMLVPLYALDLGEAF